MEICNEPHWTTDPVQVRLALAMWSTMRDAMKSYIGEESSFPPLSVKAQLLARGLPLADEACVRCEGIIVSRNMCVTDKLLLAPPTAPDPAALTNGPDPAFIRNTMEIIQTWLDDNTDHLLGTIGEVAATRVGDEDGIDDDTHRMRIDQRSLFLGSAWAQFAPDFTPIVTQQWLSRVSPTVRWKSCNESRIWEKCTPGLLLAARSEETDRIRTEIVEEACAVRILGAGGGNRETGSTTDVDARTTVCVDTTARRRQPVHNDGDSLSRLPFAKELIGVVKPTSHPLFYDPRVIADSGADVGADKRYPRVVREAVRKLVFRPAAPIQEFVEMMAAPVFRVKLVHTKEDLATLFRLIADEIDKQVAAEKKQQEHQRQEQQ